MNYPESLPCSQVDQKHEDWIRSYAYWEALRRLSEGGQLMQEAANQFLWRRPLEPNDNYRDRMNRFVPANHFGNIKGWYTSALFKQPPTVVLRQQTKTGEPVLIEDTDRKGNKAKTALAGFQNNCDRNGRSLLTFWSELVEPKLLTYRTAYVLFDLPAVGSPFPSLQAQQDTGALQPHLVAYSPQDVVNWQVDEQGNLLWVVIKVRAKYQDSFTDTPQFADRWYVFDRQQVAVYEYLIPTDQNEMTLAPLSDVVGFSGKMNMNQYGSDVRASLLPGYPRPHALSDKDMVPIFVQSLHPDHWIGQRVASPLLNLVNLENSHDWALFQGNIPMPVFYTEKEIDRIPRSETHFLQLAPEDKATFLEQSGNSFEASIKRVNELREDVYRLAYLVAQGRSSSATASMQSGYSKEQDMLPARDVLAAIGEQVRGALQQILQAASDRMGLNLDIDVQGFDFLDRADVTELEVMERGNSIMEINSPTLERERAKRIVRIQLPDANKELLDKIDDEIESNPTASEVEQQQQEQNNAARLSAASKMISPRLFAEAADAA